MQFHSGSASGGAGRRPYAVINRWQRMIGVSLLCIPVLVAAQSSPNSTSASTAPPAGDSRASKAKPATTLGEIIVTANRRREPSREVPMHVDTVQASDLQKVGARTLSDYVSYQPGVFFASSGGAGEGELIMRGVSTGNQTSPTVSVYMDDVPVGGSTEYASAATFVFDAALMDLDHIEFLYGPQGTLYGAGSMGGLVKYVTNKPDASGFSGSAGFDISHTQQAGMNYTERATLNIPLVQDKAALRVSVMDQHSAGLYRAVGETPSHGDDRTHTQGVRAQLEVDPTDKLTFNLSAMVQRIAADGLSMADYSLATGQPLSGGPYNRQLNHREPFTQTLQLYSFHAGYDFGWANLDWISSYQNFVNHSVQDYPDGFLVLYNQLYPALGGDSALSSLYVDSQYNVHKASQEIRLTSRKGDHFDWLAGLWFNREDEWEQYALEGANLPPPGQSILLAQRVNSRYQEYAGYGDVTWHITPTIDLAAGVRASGNSQHLSNFEDGSVAGSPGGFRESMVSDDITKMLTASYRPDTTHSYYMRASTGYRPGGLQAPVQSTVFGSNPNAKDTFGSDTLQSYELGYKGSHLDGRLNVGIDAYDIEWHNMQLITYTVGNAIIENAGDSRIDGLELQVTYATGPWQLSGSGAYTDARTLQGNPQQGIEDGARLPYSARETATLAAKYNFRLAGDAAYAGANLRLSSQRNAGFEGDSSDPDFNLPGFAMLDLDTGMTLHSGVSVDLYLRNALDRRVAIGTLNSESVSFLASVGGPMLVQLSTPRTLGVSVNVPF
ncbi:TonB-dependent receptor plug domain-containing protein [Rhodanobacter sp. C05]|uniref:TonB-dependent receptor n=1 Tax=Rhodanobacter sp. C05 TaxID=1945855 RepID=UPI0009862DD9|nr:TonB-dependent receptor plug domain-containing protein [Rhodanobacter sp. C05]